MAGELIPLRRDQGERSDVPREDGATDSARPPMTAPGPATRRVRVIVNNNRHRADSSHQTKHPGGRPRVSVQPAKVQEMRDRGVSWRNIGRALGISAATAIKLYRAGQGVSKPFENSRPEVQR